ncbi:MAG TPA: hypothetical protein VFL57_18860, partial [Bryobacteraceae bacterium]|nr:hypothetical protein [Bryobacteraceae bacterium]
FRALPKHVIRILVAHHPLDLPAASEHRTVRRSALAAAALSASGVDVVLSGHYHLTHFSDPAEPLRTGGHAALIVQAGTAVSNRGRGELNSFNIIRTHRDWIEVSSHTWSETAAEFRPSARVDFERCAEGWRRTAKT